MGLRGSGVCFWNGRILWHVDVSAVTRDGARRVYHPCIDDVFRAVSHVESGMFDSLVGVVWIVRILAIAEEQTGSEFGLDAQLKDWKVGLSSIIFALQAIEVQNDRVLAFGAIVMGPKVLPGLVADEVQLHVFDAGEIRHATRQGLDDGCVEVSNVRALGRAETVRSLKCSRVVASC